MTDMSDISVEVSADTTEFVDAIEDATEALEEFEAALDRVNDTESVTVDVVFDNSVLRGQTRNCNMGRYNE